MLFIRPDKVIYILKSGTQGDGPDGQRGLQDQLLRVGKAVEKKILLGAVADNLLEGVGQVICADEVFL